MRFTLGFKSLATTVVVLTAAGLSGCGLGGSEAKVSGTVTYAGHPVAAGSVNFLSREKGTAAAAPLSSTGEFKLPAPLEPGSYAVYVTPPTPEPAPPGQPPAAVPVSPIPAKARDPLTSGVVVSLKAGDNPLPIDLKD